MLVGRVVVVFGGKVGGGYFLTFVVKVREAAPALPFPIRDNSGQGN